MLTSKRNSNYTIRDMQEMDIFYLPLRDQERRIWAGIDLVQLGAGKLWAPARTLLVDDIPLCVYGIMPVWAGLWYLWSFFSSEVFTHRWMLWCTITTDWAVWRQETPGLRRVEALTLADDPPAIRVMEHLGFERQCLKEAYGPQGQGFLEWVYLAPER